MRSFAIASAFLALALAASPVVAQQKTAKACEDEWRANKADNQAKGITEKSYVAQCRAGSSPTTSAPTTTAPAAKSNTPAPTAQKTTAACRDEWQAKKDAYQAAKITESAYVTKCRAGETVELPSPTTAPAASNPPPVSHQPPPSTSNSAPAPAPTRAATAPAPSGTNQFGTEAQAKAHCASGAVVWANLDSDIYHFAGYKSYGKTKSGAYMCENDAKGQGMRASKNEKHP